MLSGYRISVIFKSAVFAALAAALFLMMTFAGCSNTAEGVIVETGPVEIMEDTVNKPETVSSEEDLKEKPGTQELPEEAGEPVEGEPEPPSDEIIFSFTVTGDSRPADDYLPMPDTFLTLLGLMDDGESSFNISVGDIINGQTADGELIARAFTDYLGATAGIYDTNFVSPGNHDIINATTRKYFREMILDKSTADASDTGIEVHNPGTPEGLNSYYYYFEFNDINFVILNAFEPGFWGEVKDTQLKWLEGVLEGLKEEVVFAAIHTPPYSFINPDIITDGSKQVGFSDRENLEYIRELFKDTMVDAVFSGHEHVYSKEYHDGTHYVITALAGEYPYFPEDQGGFYHYIRVDIMADRWVYNVIGIEGDLRYQEEIFFD